jgi:hypothetical protein
MNDILNFINSVESDQAADAKEIFNTLMLDNISGDVDTMKAEISKSMFSNEQEQDDDSEDEMPEIDLTDEELNDILQKIEDTEKKDA